jgi:predicted nucleic acid-binding protein
VTVFLDTVGLLAIWDESDQWHRAAQACFSELLACRADLVTSTFVLLECGNAAARRPYRSAVGRLRKEMEPGHRLIVPTLEDWQAAWMAYESGQTGSAGIVDHVSFTIMRRLGLSKAFTNDRHFRVAGFETLFGE